MQGPTILSPYPWVSQGITLANDTDVQLANPAPFGNTKEILVYNTSEDFPVFIRAVDTKIQQATISIILSPVPVAGIVAGDALVFDPGGLSFPLLGVAGAPGVDEFQVSPTPITLCNNIRDAINASANWSSAVTASTETYTQDGNAFCVVRLVVKQAFAVGDASNGYGVQLTNANKFPSPLNQPWTVSPGDFSAGGFVPPYTQTGYSAGGVGAAIGPADLTIANALYLPPLAAITLAIGVEGERNDLNGPNSPSGLQVAFLCGTGGTDVSLSVTYVQSIGGGGTGQRTGLGG